MPLELGGAFPPRQTVVEPEPVQPSIEDLRTEQLLSALANLQDALARMPAPVVNVAEPDLTSIVQAVTQLKGQATPAEIAQAVKLAIAPETGQQSMEPVLAEMVDALKTLDFRLKGVGQGGGVIGPKDIDIGDRAGRILGVLNHTESNRLPVDIGGAIDVSNLTVQYESRVSALNATQTPLGAGATYTGEWEDIRDFSTISVAVMADVSSAVNGAVIEFTEDPTKGAIRSVATTVPGGSGAHFSLAPQARFFRLRYTNGPTAQTVMRSEVLLKFNPPALVQQPLASPTTDANLATMVKSHLAGRLPTGQWGAVSVDSSGRLLRPSDTVTSGTVQAVDSRVMLQASGGVSSFSFDITGFTTGTFVIERTLAPDPSAAGALWTAVGAFRAGTRSSRGVWTDSPGAYHGNMSASTAVRVRVTSALNAAAAVNLLASSGTGTITIGAIASNEGNIIGAVQTLDQHYATTAGGNASWNASTDFLAMSSTGEQPVAALHNPPTSGVDLFILGYELNASATTQWRRYRNATLSALGAAQDNVNRGGDTTKAALGRLYRGAGSTTQTNTAQFARTGGTLGKGTLLAANTPLEVDLDAGVRLRPGQNWVFTAVGPGGLGGTMTVSFFADWVEVPAVA